jgi:hypothetical protein
MSQDQPRSDHDGRIRTLEEIAIRIDERGKVWDSLATRVHTVETSLQSAWAAIGQLKIKNGLVWSAVAVIGGIVSAVVTSLIAAKLGAK